MADSAKICRQNLRSGLMEFTIFYCRIPRAFPLSMRQHSTGLHACNSSTFIMQQVGTTLSDHAFSFTEPRAWNSLPESDHLADSMNTFKRLLKTFLLCFNHPTLSAKASFFELFVVLFVRLLIRPFVRSDIERLEQF